MSGEKLVQLARVKETGRVRGKAVLMVGLAIIPLSMKYRDRRPRRSQSAKE